MLVIEAIALRAMCSDAYVLKQVNLVSYLSPLLLKQKIFLFETKWLKLNRIILNQSKF